MLKKAVLLAGAVAAWLMLGGADRLLADREPRLVSVDPLPTVAGATCAWSPEYAAGGATGQTPAPAERTRALDPTPVRTIEDDYATFAAVAVDAVRDEIAVQDENLFQIRFYNRLANTPQTAALSEPKRILSGSNTEIEFNCGLYIDQANGDIYSVNNDTTDTTVVFPHGAEGNVAPARKLRTPHGTYGIAVDETNQELFLTVEHDNAVVTFRKTAGEADTPIRHIQGDHTRLADPHGVAVDAGHGWLFVANHGSTHRVSADLGPPLAPNWPLTRVYAVPGSGESWPPSITVYDRTARGDAPPLRVIQGPKTRLNWPAQMYFDAQHDELFVANDGDHSILVFSATADGDAAPIRAIGGPRTSLANPTGVWVDTVHDEVVASSMGNHSATVYPRTADGDVPPIRTIRAAPKGKQALAIGNPGAVAYDSRRDQLLVPN